MCRFNLRVQPASACQAGRLRGRTMPTPCPSVKGERAGLATRGRILAAPPATVEAGFQPASEDASCVQSPRFPLDPTDENPHARPHERPAPNRQVDLASTAQNHRQPHLVLLHPRDLVHRQSAPARCQGQQHDFPGLWTSLGQSGPPRSLPFDFVFLQMTLSDLHCSAVA
jgi:hypothetical protein